MAKSGPSALPRKTAHKTSRRITLPQAGARPPKPGLPGTKQRLLETVIDLIWEHNYTSVSVDEICRRAGVLKGSFYHFFPSKAELAVAALEDRWVRKVQERIERAFDPALSPHRRLCNYYEMVFENQRLQKERVGKICGCAFATVGSEQSHEDQKIRAKTQEVFGRYIGFIEGALRDAARDGSAGDLTPRGVPGRARELFSFVLGILFMARVEDDLKLIPQFRPAFLRLSGVKEAVTA